HVGGQVGGKLTQWDAGKGFTVQVTVTYYVLNDGEYRAMIQSELDAARARDVASRLNSMRAYADHQSRLYTQKNETVNIDFVPASEMKVRTMHPVAYDDKGKPKKLSSKELAELKGPDRRLPGYTAEVSDVRQDMTVTVYIEKKKPSKSSSKDKDDK